MLTKFLTGLARSFVRYRWFVRLFVGIFLTLSLSVGGSGCGYSVNWHLFPDKGGNCQLFEKLKENEAYQKSSPYDNPEEVFQSLDPKRSPYRRLFYEGTPEKGCFSVWWYQSSKKEQLKRTFDLVLLDATGQLRAQNEVTGRFDQNVQWKLSPQQLRGKNAEVRLFILRRLLDDSAEAHRKACEKVVTPKHRCFPSPGKNIKENPCWFYMQIEPQTDDPELFQLAKVEGGCQLCSREICGNQKDDDCDGSIDNGCKVNNCHHLNLRRSCYEGQEGTKIRGICQSGFQTCKEDKKGLLYWSPCQGEQRPLKEICNGLDDDCDGFVDEKLTDCCVAGARRSCKKGSSCPGSKEYCEYQTTSRGGAWGSCKQIQVSKTEICNGKDDDCDGKIDNKLRLKSNCSTGLKGSCAEGSESCIKGHLSCKSKQPATVEICDGKDNDCDGLVDETFKKRGTSCKVAGKKGPCAKGVYIACVKKVVICKPLIEAGKSELCGNKVDDDCNGKVDDKDSACDCKSGQSRSCYAGSSQTKGEGACRTGKQSCLPGGKWSTCLGEILPKKEICNGRDDNCDGKTDEDFLKKGKRCFLPTNRGPCAFGTYQMCTKGKLVCVADLKALLSETCSDGKDNDCNGLTDESCSCLDGKEQLCYQGPAGTAGIGTCKAGKTICSQAGFWGGCQGESLPSVEVCDGLDNDCNGRTDDFAFGVGRTCVVSTAKGVCTAGKTDCIKGRIACISLMKISLEICDGKDNNCNGSVDEKVKGLGGSCTVKGKKGLCQKGTLSCAKGKLTCLSRTKPKTEICDGKDNNCNGKIDDQLKAPKCRNQIGVCRKSIRLCVGTGGWLPCSKSDYSRQTAGFEEVETKCDGLDNDCNGKVDEHKGKALQKTCYTGPSGTLKQAGCKAGVQRCEKGRWSPCLGQKLPTKEICGNRIDEDCNGKVDDGATCFCWGSSSDTKSKKSETLFVKGTFFLDKEKRSSKEAAYMLSGRVTKIKGQILSLAKKDRWKIGEQILLIHSQGNESWVGSYEFLRIMTILKDGSLKVTTKPVGKYGSKGNENLSGQIVQILRVPQFRKVVVEPNATLTVSPWNGEKGGVMVLRVEELLWIKGRGSLSVRGKGYRGAPPLLGQPIIVMSGESYEIWKPKATDKGGAGTTPTQTGHALSGGGGGHAVDGEGGLDQGGKTAAKGGENYGTSNLSSKIRFGSGGGAGGADQSLIGKKKENQSGAGGSGGGIIILIARAIHIAGTIDARGMKGGNAKTKGAMLGGGGGGAGGSIHLVSERIIFSRTGRAFASGGKGGESAAFDSGVAVSPWKKSMGGVGGFGWIDLRFSKLNAKKQSDVKDFTPHLVEIPKSDKLPLLCR